MVVTGLRNTMNQIKTTMTILVVIKTVVTDKQVKMIITKIMVMSMTTVMVLLVTKVVKKGGIPVHRTAVVVLKREDILLMLTTETRIQILSLKYM